MVLFDFWKTLFNQKKKKKRKPPKRVKKRTRRKASKITRKKSKKTIKKRLPKKIKKRPQKKKRKKIRKAPPKKIQKKTKPKYSRKPKGEPTEKEIGVVTHYFGKISVGAIKLKAGLIIGDKIHIKGAHDDFTQHVTSMQHNHRDISLAQKGIEVGIKVSQPVHENDKVYRVASK